MGLRVESENKKHKNPLNRLSGVQNEWKEGDSEEGSTSAEIRPQGP